MAFSPVPSTLPVRFLWTLLFVLSAASPASAAPSYHPRCATVLPEKMQAQFFKGWEMEETANCATCSTSSKGAELVTLLEGVNKEVYSLRVELPSNAASCPQVLNSATLEEERILTKSGRQLAVGLYRFSLDPACETKLEQLPMGWLAHTRCTVGTACERPGEKVHTHTFLLSSDGGVQIDAGVQEKRADCSPGD
jgi:hypothetical protein